MNRFPIAFGAQSRFLSPSRNKALEEQPSVISPSVPWPPVLGKGPLQGQGTEAYRDAGAQRLPSLIGTPSRPLGLEGAPAWPSPGSHGGSGAIQTGEETPSAPGGRQPQADTRCLCTHHMAPSASAHWHAQPLPRLLAPGVLAASWPSAPFPPEWSREGGKRWGLASAGAQASLGHEVRGPA